VIIPWRPENYEQERRNNIDQMADAAITEIHEKLKKDWIPGRDVPIELGNYPVDVIDEIKRRHIEAGWRVSVGNSATSMRLSKS